MEKLGVAMDEEKVRESREPTTKTAGSGIRCPDCGAAIQNKGSVTVVKCPNCGTKPFERRNP